ncbi:28S ribosomal protein S21, mitochondrial [Galendromus occidentalis]|uniref:28S ribosomal protein S21, mitochondrial n=1 Tax=Galendromus occidentalis TaxID=34638 RepID=A0AAJ6QTE3_9ACAR|nr:28S ribosomal protein S21, mitochondrial [Galendromus occidentalis]
MRHKMFIGRTILVQNGKVEEAFRQLNRVLGIEGIFDIYRRNRYFERPTLKRRRVNYEICRAIYDEDMARRLKLTLRTNRADPWLGSH